MLRGGGIEEQVVDLVLTELLQRLLSKGLDCLELRELEWQDRHALFGTVIFQGVICLLGSSSVSGSEYDLVRLGLCEELLDGFEALCFPLEEIPMRGLGLTYHSR